LLVAHALDDLIDGGVEGGGIGMPPALRRHPPGARKSGDAG
jgi:hypothetical protein